MSLPAHLRPRREKVFGDGRPRPLDRNAKARVMLLARALMRRTEKGKAYGAISAKALAVLEALLWGFHNARSGLCFPSYETIAENAPVAPARPSPRRSRRLRRRACLRGLTASCASASAAQTCSATWGPAVRVIRTSNAYHFRDPLPSKLPDNLANSSKSGFPAETSI